MMLAQRMRTRAVAALVAVPVAAAGFVAVGVATAPAALAACTGHIEYNRSVTTVTNTSQCYQVQASIEGYVSGPRTTEFFGAIASNKSTVSLPGGATYVRNGMGLKGGPNVGFSWSYWVY